MKKPKKISTKSLISRLDFWYSKYIRLKNSVNGYCICITCGKKELVKDIDCGHYVSRIYKGTRWYEKNTFPQCKSCNRFHEGIKDVFALKLQEKFGKGILQELQNLKNQIVKFTPQDLQDKITYYQSEVKKLGG